MPPPEIHGVGRPPVPTWHAGKCIVLETMSMATIAIVLGVVRNRAIRYMAPPQAGCSVHILFAVVLGGDPTGL